MELKMVTIEFSRNEEFPAFRHFRQHVMAERDVDGNYYKNSESIYDHLNEKLKEFNARYSRLDNGATIESRFMITGWREGRKVEFASEEDYVHFCLKWS
jgi:hypothetical protein